MAKVNKQDIGFEILGIEKAVKANHVIVRVKFYGNEQVYGYIRDVDRCHIQGVKVDFTDEDENGNRSVYHMERVYNTKGGKKRITGRPVNPVTGIVDDIICDEPVMEVEPGVAKPIEDDGFVNGHIVHEQYHNIRTCIAAGIPVYLAGPAGSGKNHTVEQIASDLDMEFYFSNSIQHEYKLTGFIDAGGKYHGTEFYKACTSDKECVFFLDEIDASIPDVLVLLNAAIANGYFEFPTGRVEFDHVHFVAAGNTVGNGADDMYTGRMVIDQATLDRFAIIEFDYSERIERHITKGNLDLIGFIHQLRDQAKSKGIRVTFSYRCMTMMRKLEQSGMDIVVAIKIAVVKGLDKDTINTLNPQGNTRYHKALEQVKAAA